MNNLLPILSIFPYWEIISSDWIISTGLLISLILLGIVIYIYIKVAFDKNDKP